MSEFEFMRSLPFGQVVPGGSPIHRLDARARLLIFTLLMGVVVAAQHPLGLALAAAAGLAGVRLARLSVRYTLRSLIAPLPLLVLLAVLQLFFNTLPDSPPVLLDLGFTRITPADFLAGFMLLLRFGALVVLVSFAGQVLSTSEMAHALTALFAPLERSRFGWVRRLPVRDAVMALVVAVRYLPFLAQAAERIAKAQASRGAPPEPSAAAKRRKRRRGGILARARAMLPLLVPIFVTSLRRAEVMALAMDARGYASRAAPTSLVELHFTRRDAAALLLGAVLAAGVLLI